MSKKAILTTFVIAIAVVAAIGALSFLAAKNRPAADVAAPPVPPAPSGAPSGYPPVPPALRLKGDANNDGIVNVLDLSIIISNWQEIDAVHNLLDDANGQTNLINVLDLSQVITYWGCTEQKSGCGYYSQTAPTATPTATGTAVVPSPTATVSPLPSATTTATTTPAATATTATEYIIRRGATRAIDGYPFSILYYSNGASGYYYVYLAPRNLAGAPRCVGKFQTFSANKYSVSYICGSNQYTITLDPKRSNANQIIVLISSKTGVSTSATPTTSITPKPSPTATPVCSWYNRLRRRCF